MNTQINRPRSVTIIGWCSILAAAILILANIGSLIRYTMYDSLNLNIPGISQYVPDSMKKVADMYRYSRIWTMFEIFYFLFVLVAAIQFLRLRAWGRTALEIACWIGLLNAVVDTWLSYATWQSMQEAWSMALRGLGGGRYSYLNPLGIITIIVGFFMWVIPCVGVIFFLRTKKVREAVSLR